MTRRSQPMIHAARPILVLALACALSRPAQARSPSLTPAEFRARINLVLRGHGLAMQLGDFRPDGPGSLAVTALLTRNIRVTAQPGREQRLTSLLFVMHSVQTLESITEVVAALAAASYTLNPELTHDDREALFAELGLFDEGWSVRGLDGIAIRHGVTWRLVHPCAASPVIAIVSWAEPLEAPLRLSF